eukprot:GHVO01049064.1.p1 GENE.GHVO01049064.1~~GHVO01049064.1.p1  ORF type:complete len:115 (+),score=32.06 GHVO01049064.1:215-559(+)
MLKSAVTFMHHYNRHLPPPPPPPKVNIFQRSQAMLTMSTDMAVWSAKATQQCDTYFGGPIGLPPLLLAITQIIGTLAAYLFEDSQLDPSKSPLSVRGFPFVIDIITRETHRIHM